MDTAGAPCRSVSPALLLVFVAALLVPLARAQHYMRQCGNAGYFRNNSVYQANIKLLSTTLSQNASSSSNLFTKGSVGALPDIVYALTLCTRDTNGSYCGSCVANAFQDAQQLCPLYKDVTIIHYRTCYLRFSNTNFIASTTNDDGRFGIMINSQNVSSPVQAFDSAVGELLNATANYAAANSTSRYATGEEGSANSSYPTIYALTQCTPDLLPADCRSCLGDLIGKKLPQHDVSGKQGVTLFGIRCNLRYEVYSFFSGRPSLQLTAPVPEPVNATPTATPQGRPRNKTGTVLAIALPIGAAVLGVSLGCLFFLRRRRSQRDHPPSYSANPEGIGSLDSLLLDISTIRAATNNFAEGNRLGEGGFGAVYKGMLPDGQEIAVKRLSQSSGQGIEELKNELVLVAKVQHKNLVRLLGVCLQEHEKLLVYEYMPNRSIDTNLFDTEKSKELDWGKRLKIINGTARGLQYLHEDSQLKIIHRDVKASNVLLDSDYTPKISDFGLARLFGWEQSRDVTNRVVGTYGYMAPEYAIRGHYSMKSDVFSFGVLILEILTGRKSTASLNVEQSPVDLLSLVWMHWTAGTIVEIIDPSLRGNDAPGAEQMLKCVHIGLLCVQPNPVERPMMSIVNVMLSTNTVSLAAPLKPVFFTSDGSTYASNVSESGAVSLNEVSITELEPR